VVPVSPAEIHQCFASSHQWGDLQSQALAEYWWSEDFFEKVLQGLFGERIKIFTFTWQHFTHNGVLPINLERQKNYQFAP
jgi:hypothetical protein